MNSDIKIAIKAEKRAKENLINYKLSRPGSFSLTSCVISRMLQEMNKESPVEKLERSFYARASKSGINAPAKLTLQALEKTQNISGKIKALEGFDLCFSNENTKVLNMQKNLASERKNFFKNLAHE